MGYIKENTVFKGNAVGVDPAGCACTDCCVGDSIPLDETWNLEELAKEHLLYGRKIANRSSQKLLVYRDDEGTYRIKGVDDDFRVLASVIES